jgi:hypothetical protein
MPDTPLLTHEFERGEGIWCVCGEKRERHGGSPTMPDTPVQHGHLDVEANPSYESNVTIHGHLDVEANPSYESNVTIHGHVNGEKPHRHKDAPSWDAIGTQYVGPARAEKILRNDRDFVEPHDA